MSKKLGYVMDHQRTRKFVKLWSSAIASGSGVTVGMLILYH